MTVLNVAAAGTFTLGGDLVVNRLGFGAMRITGKGIWGEPADRDEALRVLHRLPELGINFIDTADAYGPEVSENLIHEALHPYKGIVVATKGGNTRHGPDIWAAVGRPEYLRQCVLMSLRRLGVERIDLWQLHRIDRKVDREEQFQVIADMHREGLIRHVGLSEVSVEEIQAAQQYFPVVSVQNLYNLTMRQSEEVLNYCEVSNRLHPLVPAGGRWPARGHAAGRDCGEGGRHHRAGGAGLGAQAQPGDAADPRHEQGRSSGRECGGRGTHVER